ncbi:FkbH domain protein, partial [Streptococcus mutans]|nr:FkbH domain protein [Streptococcus mutans]
MVKTDLDSFGNSLFDREKIGYELKKTALDGDLKIAIIGDGNVDSIENYIYYYFKDYSISTFIGDPGNYLNELLNKDSNLYKFNPDYLFIIVTGDFLVDYYLNSNQLNQYEILMENI